MEQRQHADDLVFAGFGYALRIAPGLVDRACGAEVAMGEHGALGYAGGAAGVLKQRDVIDTHGRPFARQLLFAVCAQLVEPYDGRIGCDGSGGYGRRAEGRVVADDEMVHQPIRPELLGHQRHEADVGRDQNARTGILQLEGELAFRVERREMDDARAALEGGEKRDRVVRRVGEIEGDSVAGLYTQIDKPRRDGIDRARATASRSLCSSRYSRAVFEFHFSVKASNKTGSGAVSIGVSHCTPGG